MADLNPQHHPDGSVCCGDEAWRGRLCPYHEGFQDATPDSLTDDEYTRLREENTELQALFDLQWTRMGEAAELWRAASPELREGKIPDLGNLLTWFLERVEELQAEGSDSYDYGYEDGEGEGYDEGFSDGRQEGYDEGLAEGLAQAQGVSSAVEARHAFAQYDQDKGNHT